MKGGEKEAEGERWRGREVERKRSGEEVRWRGNAWDLTGQAERFFSSSGSGGHWRWAFDHF